MENKLLKKLRKNEEAVSPVIAVILMVAITVVLAAVLYNWAMQFMQTDKQTPRAGAVTEPHAVGFKMKIVDIDKEIAVTAVEYYLKDAGGVAVPGEQGSVEDIYGLKIEDEGVTIAFDDADRDGKLSSGDTFFVKDLDHGGVAASGYSLRIAFDVTGDTIVEKTF